MISVPPCILQHHWQLPKVSCKERGHDIRAVSFFRPCGPTTAFPGALAGESLVHMSCCTTDCIRLVYGQRKPYKKSDGCFTALHPMQEHRILRPLRSV